MESVCYVCTKQSNTEALKAALSDICSIPLSFMDQIQDISSANKDHLLKCISMLTGAVKAQSDLDEVIMNALDTMLPLVEKVWDKLMAIL